MHPGSDIRPRVRSGKTTSAHASFGVDGLGAPGVHVGRDVQPQTSVPVLVVVPAEEGLTVAQGRPTSPTPTPNGRVSSDRRLVLERTITGAR